MAATQASARIPVTTETIQHAKDTPSLEGAQLALHTANGAEVPLPQDLQLALLRVLRSLALNGSATLATLPEELTTTTAADMLGVSRPTLMKWVGAQEIPSHQVGSHTRFLLADVMDKKAERAEARQAAFDALRGLEAEHDLLD